MNDQEFAVYQLHDQTSSSSEKSRSRSKGKAKVALLAQLGITEEQAKLLLS
jgi:hypothetical protein